MSHFRLRWLVAVIVTQGCATISSGPYGIPLDASSRPVPGPAAAPLRVSAAEIAGVSNPYFGLVEVTFENDSPAWVQIDPAATGRALR
jgi:hypothetical protein